MTKIKQQKNSVFLRYMTLACLVLICNQSFAQAKSIENTELSKNNFYVEGHIGLYSQILANYERQIRSGAKVSWYGRVGCGYGQIFFTNGGAGGLGAITMLTGKKNDHFELNAGAFIGDGDGTFIFPLLNAGYRHQEPNGGLIFRANVGIISLGISLGYAF